jgi:hypothetical protein
LLCRISGLGLADPIIYLVFLQIRQQKNGTTIYLVTKIYLLFYQKYSCQVSGRVSGIRLSPDIRYPAFGLAGYPAKTVSGASLIIYSQKMYGTVCCNRIFTDGINCQYRIVSVPVPNVARLLLLRSRCCKVPHYIG